MFVQSAHESYNTYIVTKKEIEIIQKKRSEKENKMQLEEKSWLGRTAELDHLNSKLERKQNNERIAEEIIVIGNKNLQKTITKRNLSQMDIQAAQSLIDMGVE